MTNEQVMETKEELFENTPAIVLCAVCDELTQDDDDDDEDWERTAKQYLFTLERFSEIMDSQDEKIGKLEEDNEALKALAITLMIKDLSPEIIELTKKCHLNITHHDLEQIDITN